MIEDTSRRDPVVHLMGSMADGSNGYISGMESAAACNPTLGSDDR